VRFAAELPAAAAAAKEEKSSLDIKQTCL